MGKGKEERVFFIPRELTLPGSAKSNKRIGGEVGIFYVCYLWSMLAHNTR